MNIFDIETNKRIISGNFPDMILYPAKIADIMPDDIDKKAKAGLVAIEKYPWLFSSLFIAIRNRYVEMKTVDRSDWFQHEVNFLINTGFPADVTSPLNKSYSDGVGLVPVVTELDKILWTGIAIYYTSREYDSKHFTDGHNSMLYVFLYLLLSSEKKEQETGRTVSVDRFIKAGASIDDLLESWDNSHKRIFTALTAKERNAYESLTRQRDKLLSQLKEETKKAHDIAEITDSEWTVFIQIINDMTLKETSVMNSILQSTSAKEKLSAIYEYQSYLKIVERGKYILNGKEISLLPILDAVNDRFQKAPCFATVYTDRESPFMLFPTVFNLVISATTYNYLLISFHLFRMKQDKDTAKEFALLALKLLKNNLGIESKSDWVSLSDIIEDFYSTVIKFYKENEGIFNRLSFCKIKSDAAAASASLSGTDSMDIYMDDLFARVHEYENSKEYDKKIETLIMQKDTPHSREEVQRYIANEEQREELKEQEAQATQLIRSLNIVYMFCEALRIILGNKRISAKIRNTDKISTYRKELLKLDDKLVHKVYDNLDEQEIGMLEYREKYGIVSGILSDQESREEKFRNQTFSDILKDIVDEITFKIESQDVKQLIEIKRRVREEILRFPDCDEKDQYAEWLDGVSDRISNALVSNCQIQDDYEQVKNSIIVELGSDARILPDTTLDSLTTAEMLYFRYASTNFEDKGFDFSCISALYYQAFEEAYNTLIWKKYADFLNNLIVDGQAYTEILENSRGVSIKNPNARGYLDDDARQRDYYIEYKSKRKQRLKTEINSRCMYTSFAILLEKISVNSPLDKFCDFFAGLAGFNNRTEMFNDALFMKECLEFSGMVTSSAGSRNNASHGGTFISLEQCSSDKKTVLYALKDIRDESLGLIQLLLSIIKEK